MRLPLRMKIKEKKLTKTAYFKKTQVPAREFCFLRRNHDCIIAQWNPGIRSLLTYVSLKIEKRSKTSRVVVFYGREFNCFDRFRTTEFEETRCMETFKS